MGSREAVPRLARRHNDLKFGVTTYGIVWFKKWTIAPAAWPCPYAPSAWASTLGTVPRRVRRPRSGYMREGPRQRLVIDVHHRYRCGACALAGSGRARQRMSHCPTSRTSGQSVPWATTTCVVRPAATFVPVPARFADPCTVGRGGARKVTDERKGQQLSAAADRHASDWSRGGERPLFREGLKTPSRRTGTAYCWRPRCGRSRRSSSPRR
jgi:hypothetical protein